MVIIEIFGLNGLVLDINKLVLQWGTLNNVTTPYTITLSITYTNLPYTAVTSGNFAFIVTDWKNTGFVIRSTTTTTTNYAKWFSIGRI